MSKRKKLLLTALSITALGIIFGANFHKQSSAQEVVVYIPKNSGVEEISESLLNENLIGSKQLFKLYAFVSGRAHLIKPGLYFIKPGTSNWQIIEILSAGPKEINITLTPGSTLAEDDEDLSRLHIIRAGELLRFNPAPLIDRYPWLLEALRLTGNQEEYKIDSNGLNLEGFIYPDTYRFYQGSDVSDVVKKILDNFEDKALLAVGKENLRKTIILASLVEKEVSDKTDKGVVAGILNKRLTNKTTVDVDATVVYIKCQGKFRGCRPKLSRQDFEVNSPYNTYRYLGLPPSPISSPGLGAIEAAANPTSSNYWYYLSDPKTGKTIYAKTLDEQNKNRALYLSIE